MNRLGVISPGLSGLADPSFSDAVIGWQKQHGRHSLPWQNTRDAYRVWLSEIMLQQTTVAAVLGYYERFLARFPTVQALAEAPSEDVMALWAGLGYYTRARNLHACAKRVVAEHASMFPSDPALLAELPGIGRSTAAAIAAFSYGTRAAILDGNVKRVFARVFGVEGFPGEKKIEDALWLRAEALLPGDEGIEAYTQGLMDLGATLCTRSSPACERCPLAARCVARASGRTAELPVRKPKKAVPEKFAVMFVVIDGGEVLLEQRPDSGIWGGLVSLPELDGHQPLEASGDRPSTGTIPGFLERAQESGTVPVRGQSLAAAARFGAVEEVTELLPLVHVFTHYKLHILPYVVRLSSRGTPAGHQRWWPAAALHTAALPSPIRKVLGFLSEPDLLSA